MNLNTGAGEKHAWEIPVSGVQVHQRPERAHKSARTSFLLVPATSESEHRPDERGL